jgi:hypothetical protein
MKYATFLLYSLFELCVQTVRYSTLTSRSSCAEMNVLKCDRHLLLQEHPNYPCENRNVTPNKLLHQMSWEQQFLI